MNKEQLMKLAEWYGYVVYPEDLFKGKMPKNWDNIWNDGKRLKIDGDEIIFISGNSSSWNPLEDSNQLDMLEDKMIEEAKINKITHSFFHETQVGEWLVEYWNVDKEKRIIAGTGKTKNEARLNAIIKYVESK